jgi:hypothetical protein
MDPGDGRRSEEEGAARARRWGNRPALGEVGAGGVGWWWRRPAPARTPVSSAVGRRGRKERRGRSLGEPWTVVEREDRDEISG